MPSQQIIRQLTTAIKDKNIEQVKHLFDSSELKSSKSETAGLFLHAAIQERFIPCIYFLLEQNPSLIISNKNGQTPLTLAVFMNLADIVKVLIDNGADVNATGTTKSHIKAVKNYSPLHAAAETGNFALLTLLINEGADVNKVRETSTRNSMPMIHGRGASVSYQNVEKETALDLAIKSHSELSIDCLTEMKALSGKLEDKDESNNFCVIM